MLQHPNFKQGCYSTNTPKLCKDADLRPIQIAQNPSSYFI